MDMVSERAQLILGLRQNGVLNQAVLAALEAIPRELFVPETFARHAYDDSALPIGRGQTISQPLIVARMTDALDLTRRHKVLEIAGGRIAFSHSGPAQYQHPIWRWVSRLGRAGPV